MPFDGTIYDFGHTKVKVTELAPDLRKASLEGLAYVLEHEELWPLVRGSRWRWNFSIVETDCGTAGCALGLAKQLWPAQAARLSASQLARSFFGLNGARADDIFAWGASDPEITPEIVAARIRDYLAGRRIRYRREGDCV